MFTKLVRIGKDAELRSANGKPVLSLSVVYDVGYGANKKGQWLNLAMWGAQAEKVGQYFTKGKQIVVRVDDVHIDEYNGKSSLKGTLVSFEFVHEAKQQSEHYEQQERPAPRTQQRQAPVDLDDESLPF
jgi:single-strand DNA-binding protein